MEHSTAVHLGGCQWLEDETPAGPEQPQWLSVVPQCSPVASVAQGAPLCPLCPLQSQTWPLTRRGRPACLVVCPVSLVSLMALFLVTAIFPP